MDASSLADLRHEPVADDEALRIAAQGVAGASDLEAVPAIDALCVSFGSINLRMMSHRQGV